ncbi:MAG TPA: amidohydrolase family protein [Roseiarcus sp.]|nr:amidohydrolase family protein [Roseiarcus sp.]
MTPTIYGVDSSATIAAIAGIGRDRARGVVFADRATSEEALNAMNEAGVVGLRLFLASRDGRIDAAQSADRLRWAAALAAPRSWHLDISTPPDVIGVVAHDLAASPVPIVLDYFGWAQGGVQQRGFDSIIDLLKSGRAYVKLSEPYRLSNDYPEYRDLTPVVRAYITANPDRVLWGSGWPHVASGGNGHSRLELSPNLRVETARFLDLLAEWIPDMSIRQKILVDNPERLYGFSSA